LARSLCPGRRIRGPKTATYVGLSLVLIGVGADDGLRRGIHARHPGRCPAVLTLQPYPFPLVVTVVVVAAGARVEDVFCIFLLGRRIRFPTIILIVLHSVQRRLVLVSPSKRRRAGVQSPLLICSLRLDRRIGRPKTATYFGLSLIYIDCGVSADDGLGRGIHAHHLGRCPAVLTPQPYPFPLIVAIIFAAGARVEDVIHILLRGRWIRFPTIVLIVRVLPSDIIPTADAARTTFILLMDHATQPQLRVAAHDVPADPFANVVLGQSQDAAYLPVEPPGRAVRLCHLFWRTVVLDDVVIGFFRGRCIVICWLGRFATLCCRLCCCRRRRGGCIHTTLPLLAPDPAIPQPLVLGDRILLGRDAIIIVIGSVANVRDTFRALHAVQIERAGILRLATVQALALRHHDGQRHDGRLHLDVDLHGPVVEGGEESSHDVAVLHLGEGMFRDANGAIVVIVVVFLDIIAIIVIDSDANDVLDNVIIAVGKRRNIITALHPHTMHRLLQVIPSYIIVQLVVLAYGLYHEHIHQGRRGEASFDATVLEECGGGGAAG